MPGLLTRLHPHDSIAQFELAAKERFAEASLLYYGRRRYAAIYFYGYAVEMWLKAAYFHNEGIIANVGDPLTDIDRNRAWAQRAAAGAPVRRTTQHDVEVWAYLLIYIRQAVRREMASLGARETGSGLELRFPYRALAEQAINQLESKFGRGYFALAQEVGSVGHWARA